MNNKHSSHPLICIDFKKNRIRIHRNTLRQIGNPEYIQLLVNPDQKMIGIKASCAEDKLAHKVKDYFVINGNSYELYSRELLYSLSQLNLSWEKFNIFRLEGNIYPDKKIARRKEIRFSSCNAMFSATSCASRSGLFTSLISTISFLSVSF